MSKLLINESPLSVLPTLAKMIGLNEAIVLQQVQYWIANPKAGETIGGHKWIYNTYEQWQEGNFSFWSIETVKRTFLQLEKIGALVSAQLSENKWDKTKYYRIDYDKLEQLVVPNDDVNYTPIDGVTDAPSTIIQRLPETTGDKKTPQKKGDYLDLLAELSGSEQTQKELQVSAMYDKMDRLFRTTFSRNKNTDNIVKFVLLRENQGEFIERFVEWVNRDEFNASRIWEYAENPIKIKTRWQVAMSENPNEYTGSIEISDDYEY